MSKNMFTFHPNCRPEREGGLCSPSVGYFDRRVGLGPRYQIKYTKVNRLGGGGGQNPMTPPYCTMYRLNMFGMCLHDVYTHQIHIQSYSTDN